LLGANNHPHHPHHHGGDDALVLPSTFPDNLRWLALVMGVRLRAQRQTLEHGRYTGKAGPQTPPIIKLGRHVRHLFGVQSARSVATRGK